CLAVFLLERKRPLDFDVGAVRVNDPHASRLSLGSASPNKLRFPALIGVTADRPLSQLIRASEAALHNDLASLDREIVRVKVAGMELSSWNYRAHIRRERLGHTHQARGCQ